MTAWVNARFEVWSNHNQAQELVATYATKEAADAKASEINSPPKAD